MELHIRFLHHGVWRGLAHRFRRLGAPLLRRIAFCSQAFPKPLMLSEDPCGAPPAIPLPSECSQLEKPSKRSCLFSTCPPPFIQEGCAKYLSAVIVSLALTHQRYATSVSLEMRCNYPARLLPSRWTSALFLLEAVLQFSQEHFLQTSFCLRCYVVLFSQ